jgi:hypothetical protein
VTAVYAGKALAGRLEHGRGGSESGVSGSSVGGHLQLRQLVRGRPGRGLGEQAAGLLGFRKGHGAAGMEVAPVIGVMRSRP